MIWLCVVDIEGCECRWIWIPNLLLAAKFLLEVKDLHGPESSKAAGKLFQWSITYLSAFSLTLVIGALL